MRNACPAVEDRARLTGIWSTSVRLASISVTGTTLISMRRRFLSAAPALLVITIVACAPNREPQPAAPTQPGSPDAAAVTRRPIETPPPAASTPSPGPPASAAAPPAVVVPPGAIYVCVAGAGSAATQTAIEYAPKVGELCRKHPEMGPCQYERNVCRSKGGRVFAADGKEITMATEAEYDRKVRRVTFKAN
jgi:hypothetical protein